MGDVTPKELRKIFKSFNVNEEKIKILIDDFEYYIKNGEHRDFERWKNRDNWFTN